jgi:hypothetical protein
MSRSLLFPGNGIAFRSAALFFCVSLIAAQTPPSSAPSDKELCKRNLLLIHDAIQAYRLAHKELPDTLAELFPAYLSERKVLFCPVARKRALTSVAVTNRRDVSDAGTSYFYEFSPAPSPEIPGRTQRDWKRAQMGMLGSVVPIARCLLHDHPINLSFGGEIYESERLDWEYKFTNLVEYARLQENYLLSPVHASRVVQISPRDPAAAPEQIDLSDFYNGSLAKSWLNGKATLNFATFTTGLHEVLGVRFDVRGVIQLSSPALGRLGEDFPERVTIPLNRFCHQLHFLLGSSLADKSAAEAGRFDIHFVDGETVQFPFRLRTEPHSNAVQNLSRLASATSAWRAQPPGTAELFKLAWTNERPTAKVRAIDCLSSINTDVFLVALTVTP